MTIAIPDNRVLILVAKDGGGFQSEGIEDAPDPGGSISNGDTLSRSISGLGARSVSQYEFTTNHIKAASIGQDSSYGNIKLGKDTYYGGTSSDIDIVTDSERGKVWFGKSGVGGEFNAALQINFADIPAQTRVRIAYWIKSDVYAASPSGQWKMTRFASNGTTDPPVVATFNWFGGNGDLVDFKNQEGSDVSYWLNGGAFPDSQDEWVKYVYEVYTGTQGVEDGAYRIKFITQSGQGQVASNTSTSGDWPDDLEVYADGGRFNRFYIQNYSGNGLGEMDFYHDALVAQVGSWASIEIGNNADYGSCTILEDQEIVSWSESGGSTDVSFKANIGLLPSGDCTIFYKNDAGAVVHSESAEVSA